MGSGLAGGPLTGGPSVAPSVVAPAGQSAVVVGPLGAGATDVVTKIGSSVTDGAVNAAAKLVSFRTGIGGTEVEYSYLTKGALYLGGTGLWAIDKSTSDLYFATGGSLLTRYLASTGFVRHGFGLSVANGVAGTDTFSVPISGRVDQSGTDSTGTPGNATIDKPTGKSAIAAAAASVTITCNLCVATSRVMITPHARDATCKELIVVPGAGSFVVSGSAVATATLPFSWEVSTIL